MMNPTIANILTHPTTKIQLISLNYIQTHKKKKSHINTKRETKQKAKCKLKL